MTLQIFSDTEGSDEWLALPPEQRCQGSDAWKLLRSGIPTASEFHSVMAKARDGSASGATRTGYLRQLCAEQISGDVEPGYESPDMLKGREFEDEARKHYCMMTGNEIRRIVFAKTEHAGCSPDGAIVGQSGGLEIKVPKAKTLIEIIDRGELPARYVAQVQGTMWVMDWEFMDFYAYNPKMPVQFKIRVPRDVRYIVDLDMQVRRFNADLAALVERIRGS